MICRDFQVEVTRAVRAKPPLMPIHFLKAKKVTSLFYRLLQMYFQLLGQPEQEI
jgi:hypothetical protein